MTSSHTPTRSPSQSVLDDFSGITDSTDTLRELLIAEGMTLKNPAGIFAANARLVGGSEALRAAVGRTTGRDNAGPIAIPSGDKRFSDAAYQDNPA